MNISPNLSLSDNSQISQQRSFHEQMNNDADSKDSNTTDLLKEFEALNKNYNQADQQQNFQNPQTRSSQVQQQQQPINYQQQAAWIDGQFDQLTVQKMTLRAKIFSPDLIESIEEDQSDEEANEQLMHKRGQGSHSTQKSNINIHEERKVLLRNFDEEILDDAYKKELRQFFGQTSEQSPNKLRQKRQNSSNFLGSSSILGHPQCTPFSSIIEDLNEIVSNNNLSVSQFENLSPDQQQNIILANQKDKLERLQKPGIKSWLHDKYQTQIYKKNLHEFDLFLVQNIRAHSDSVWVAKFSPDGLYLATGGKDAVLKIWQVNQVPSELKFSNENPKEFTKQIGDCYRLFDDKPFREFREHEYDILDIAWCKNKANLLLTCSFDCKVILWDLQKERHIEIFEHQDVPTKVAFNPDLDNLFVTGSLDKTLRLWNIDQKLKPLDTQQTQDHITALCFSNEGERLVAGLATGQCVIYSCDLLGRINYITRIDCKNRRGKFSAGRKISGVQFLSKNEILIATNDSRLRLFNLEDCIQKYKYKGHKNENLQIEPSLSENQEHIMMGSEDGYIYIWNRVNDHIPVINARITQNVIKNNRVKSFESFLPFDDIKILAPTTVFAPNETLKIQQAKHQKIQQANLSSSIKAIIVACSTDGRLRVFIDEKLDGQIKEEDQEEDLQDYQSREGSPIISQDDSDSDDSKSSPETNQNKNIKKLDINKL
ncbi:wd repeat-containing protein [Stylonychia lemnae]|uniref:Wd repeat-containing protein n=1 Tax=Stylonychia lemnae TaxID=5949 RepID=A0A078B3E3_STYLE|nr:wd repeat-containing protein [Stylonychia lemnae]|eukprot:CDW88776.1 wd repeat-containing protein [Stylonychia lemnae]